MREPTTHAEGQLNALSIDKLSEGQHVDPILPGLVPVGRQRTASAGWCAIARGLQQGHPARIFSRRCVAEARDKAREVLGRAWMPVYRSSWHGDAASDGAEGDDARQIGRRRTRRRGATRGERTRVARRGHAYRPARSRRLSGLPARRFAKDDLHAARDRIGEGNSHMGNGFWAMWGRS